MSNSAKIKKSKSDLTWYLCFKLKKKNCNSSTPNLRVWGRKSMAIWRNMASRSDTPNLKRQPTSWIERLPCLKSRSRRELPKLIWSKHQRKKLPRRETLQLLQSMLIWSLKNCRIRPFWQEKWATKSHNNLELTEKISSLSKGNPLITRTSIASSSNVSRSMEAPSPCPHL